VISRRDALMGVACVVAAGAAYALTPRRSLALLPHGLRMDRIVPDAFNGWTSRDVTDEFAPQTEDSLLAKLYGETVGRLYTDPASGAEVLMLLAHGDVQSNELQLHRPEVCFPAYGWKIDSSAEMDVPLAPQVTLPARKLVAHLEHTQLSTIYWTRLGEYFPVSGNEQRVDRVRAALDGYVPDGLLARFSVEGIEPERAFALLTRLIGELVAAVKPSVRAPLIGTPRARTMLAMGH
jgi:EpsI family protein